MEGEVKKQKSRAIKMIVIGFAGPIILLIITLILSSALNFVTNSQATSGSVDIVRTIINIILLFIGIIAVSGFIWGPILGIFGIVKLTKLSKQNTSQTNGSTSVSSPTQPVQNTSSQASIDNLAQQPQTPNDSNIQQEGDNNVT